MSEKCFAFFSPLIPESLCAEISALHFLKGLLNLNVLPGETWSLAASMSIQSELCVGRIIGWLGWFVLPRRDALPSPLVPYSCTNYYITKPVIIFAEFTVGGRDGKPPSSFVFDCRSHVVLFLLS